MSKNIIIVTGASSGMGREFVRQLDKVCPENIDEFWLIARRKERLLELTKEVNHRCEILPYDLTDSTSIAKLAYKLKTQDCAVRILVNCAGFGLIGRFTELSIDRQLEMIDINCKAMVKLTYICLPYMKRNSRIINLASAASFAPQPDFVIYAATKAFAESFNRALNRELYSRHIYVTSVCPGPVDTEFFDIAQVNQNSPAWKKIAMASAKNVVKKAICDSIKKKSISVYGLPMNAWRICSRAIPTDLLMHIYH